MPEGYKMKKFLAGAAVMLYVISTVFFCSSMENQKEEGRSVSATDLGVMCISTVYPSMEIETADSRDNEAMQSQEEQAKEQTGEEQQAESPEQSKEPVVTGEDPVVLILHTHATESYLPASGGNFHSKEEASTVRDVGNTLAATLEKQGIPVVHDTTLHDYPSYNNSYSRSYQTAQQLLQKYPTVKCVIDLHRDAISSDSPAATVSINGKTCAKYSYVIGTAASTYQSNLAFVKSLNQVASANYSGFTGKVLERGYKYNQDLSSKYLLLEIGYNQNQIEDCRNTAEVFGNILAETLKKG